MDRPVELRGDPLWSDSIEVEVVGLTLLCLPDEHPPTPTDPRHHRLDDTYRESRRDCSIDRIPAGTEELEPRLTRLWMRGGDRKSTRLNSSHVAISYAVFCLKKKKIKT